MRKYRKLFIFIGIIIILLIASIIIDRPYTYTIIRDDIIQTDLERRQDIWLSALIWCESRGFALAINPKDRDGTPSYGILQFKPETFDLYVKRYDIQDKMELMNPESQIRVVRNMIGDPRVQFQNEFPDCVKKIGYPPLR